MNTLDATYMQMSRAKLTVPLPTKTKRGGMVMVNELPLVTQSLANVIASVVWSVASPRGQSNIQKTIENSVKRSFLPYINALARGDRRSLHHVYEWNKAGVTSARLFDLKVPEGEGGRANFSMRVSFRQSRTLVPLTEPQARPNPVTGRVVERKHVFHNKAMVMEYGQDVVIRPLGNNYMAWAVNRSIYDWDKIAGNSAPSTSDSNLAFSRKPVYLSFKYMRTYHGFQKALESYFAGLGSSDISRSVNGYMERAVKSSARTAQLIDIEVPSDAYAHQVAQRVVTSLRVAG